MVKNKEKSKEKRITSIIDYIAFILLAIGLTFFIIPILSLTTEEFDFSILMLSFLIIGIIIMLIGGLLLLFTIFIYPKIYQKRIDKDKNKQKTGFKLFTKNQRS